MLSHWWTEKDGSLKRLPGGLELLVLREHPRQAVVKLRLGRPKPDRLSIRRDRVGRTVQDMQGAREIDPCFGVSRIDLDNLLEMLDRFIKLAGFLQPDAQAVERIGVPGIDGQRCAGGGDGFIKAIQTEQRHGEIERDDEQRLAESPASSCHCGLWDPASAGLALVIDGPPGDGTPADQFVQAGSPATGLKRQWRCPWRIPLVS